MSNEIRFDFFDVPFLLVLEPLKKSPNIQADMMKIAILLGSPDISGGTYVIYEHGTRLQKFGHHVTIVTETEIDPERHSWHSTAAELDWLTLAQTTEKEFDIVLATWWQSPFLLHQVRAPHYVYFVQSIESRFFEAEDPAYHDRRDLSIWQEFCESSYSFNMPIITEAQWIQEYLHKKYSNSAWLVRNGIRKDIYKEEGTALQPRQEGKLRALVEGPVDVFYKNVSKSIELCCKAGVDEIWLLSSSDIETFPGISRVFSRIPIHDTPAIYRSCDVLVKLSYIEGMFGPPLEMFHCGGTAIVYDVTGHDEYIVHGENSYVVKKDDEEQVVHYLKVLKENPEILQNLKRGAVATALNWPDWKVSSEEFAQALFKITKQQGTSREYLKTWTKKLKNDSITRFSAKTTQQFQNRESGNSSCAVKLDNFVQLYYWHEGEGFQPDNILWFHYICGEPVRADFEIVLSGFPFWIRIDPSVRIGILEIDSIEIVNERNGEKVLSCSTPDQLNQLYVTGTLRTFKSDSKNTYLSYGDDPQMILPAVEDGKIGDRLKVSFAFTESSITFFLEQNCAANSQTDLSFERQPDGAHKSLVRRFVRQMKNILRK